MPSNDPVERHYTHGNLVDAIAAGVSALGKNPESVTLDDLAPVDEFHIGGREATEALTSQLSLSDDNHVLDVGSGLGGASRFVGDRFGCRVSGVDLTAEYVEAARTMTAWVGLSGRLDFHHGSALEMPFEDNSFGAAFMLHVGMNIPDKLALFTEVARVLKPGGSFGVYDIMETAPGDLVLPVPWATEPANSAVATPDTYKSALDESGFAVVAERDRRDFAIEFFRKLRARMAEAEGPPPLGLHIVMGAEAQTKIANVVANIEAGRIAPFELIARRR